MVDKRPVSAISAYLTERLFDIWDLRRIGMPQVDIAKRLGISRQAVSQALEDATGRVNKALTEQAQISKIEIESIDATNGLLSGWSREFSVKAVISVSRRDGLQVWYEHEADCAHCNRYSACQSYLFRAAKERGMTLTKDQKNLPPSKLAQLLFGMTDK